MIWYGEMTEVFRALVQVLMLVFAFTFWTLEDEMTFAGSLSLCLGFGAWTEAGVWEAPRWRGNASKHLSLNTWFLGRDRSGEFVKTFL
jgi:hypothetical protein